MKVGRCRRARVMELRAAALACCQAMVMLGCDIGEVAETVSTSARCMAASFQAVAERGCCSNFECPAGTACEGAQPGCDEHEERGRCEPPYSPRAQSDALIVGFASTEFEVRVIRTKETSFELEAPQGAAYVVCGLIVGEPDVSGGALGRIHNEDLVLYRSHVFRIPQGDLVLPRVIRFGLADLATERTPPTCVGTAEFNDFGDKNPNYPIVTDLELGCWAYAGERILSATRLIPLTPSDLPEVKPLVESCAMAGSDGRFCIPQASVGRCSRARCEPLDKLDGGVTPPGTSDAGYPELPVACSEGTEGRTCSLGSEFSVGRCSSNFCVNQDVDRLPLPLVVESCELPGQRTDWLNCFDARVQGYGTCQQRACRLRCASAADCEQIATFTATPDLACVKIDAAGRLRCASDETNQNSSISHLGICLPRNVHACN